jgi:hypothetical protein
MENGWRVRSKASEGDFLACESTFALSVWTPVFLECVCADHTDGVLLSPGNLELLHQPQSTRASTPIGIRSALQWAFSEALRLVFYLRISQMDTSGRSHDAWDTCTHVLLTSHANVDILRPGFPVRKQRDDRRVVEAILARFVDSSPQRLRAHLRPPASASPTSPNWRNLANSQHRRLRVGDFRT